MGGSAIRTAAIGAAALLALAVVGPGPAAANPARIVSTQLCADQLLLLLADRERIAALSYFAADPSFSAMAGTAVGLPRTRGVVEEVLPFDPDIVFAGAFSARPTVFLLRRLGRRVVELPVAATFDDIARNIRLVAAAIGEAQRGEDLAAAFDDALAERPVPEAAAARPVAALYWSKGYTPASASLAAEAARRAGYVDLGTAIGLPGAARVSLERLIVANPDLVVVARRGPAALADLPLRHPALDRTFGPDRILAMPHRLWICGAPFVVEAIDRLRAKRQGAGG